MEENYDVRIQTTTGNNLTPSKINTSTGANGDEGNLKSSFLESIFTILSVT